MERAGLLDWKLFASTFGVVFLAELGDKTQLATLSLAAGSGSRMTVLFAAGSALLASTLVAVVLGSVLGNVFEGPWLKRVAGALFLIMGILFLIGKG